MVHPIFLLFVLVYVINSDINEYEQFSLINTTASFEIVDNRCFRNGHRIVINCQINVNEDRDALIPLTLIPIKFRPSSDQPISLVYCNRVGMSVSAGTINSDGNIYQHVSTFVKDDIWVVSAEYFI